MTFRINAPIDTNQHKGLLAVNSISGSPLAITGLSLTNAQPIHVAIVDSAGSQVTSFGGGTQYTDGGVPPAHPIGSTIEWSDGSNWQTASTAKPLPITVVGNPALAANQSVNQAQIAGATTSVGVGASGTGTQRVVQANDSGKTLVSTGGSAASSGNNTLVGAGTNKLKVYAFTLSTTSTTSVTCIFQSGASGTELWRVVLQAPTSVSTGANLVITPPAYIFATASATLLNLNLSSAQTVHWAVSYFDES